MLLSTLVGTLGLFQLAVSRRPNVVVILTDDQDVVLDGMTPLKTTKKLVGEEGSTFAKAFATTPICCPSRSSFLTGLYMHSHGTVNNSIAGGCSNRRWQERQEQDTFATDLHRSGYRTFYAGKYLNKYGVTSSGGVGHVPEGWDWWIGLVGNSVYYNYTLSVNGSGVMRGDDESDYLTDVLKEYSLSFLSEEGIGREPFLMVVSTPSPHEPFTPARRHAGKFSGFAAPRTPNFNAPVKDSRHWLLRLKPDVLPPETVDRIDQVFRNRWETLLAVDELVEAIIERLSHLRVLDDTFIIFTSDHGFHLGQFGQPWDKRQPYETDIRVPLLVRGPKVLKRVIDDPVLNIDIAPTILDMAGVSTLRKIDGKSFLPLLTSEVKEALPRTFLIEYQGESESKKKKNPCYDDTNLKLCQVDASCKCFDSKNNTFACVRHYSKTADDIFCHFDDGESFQEFYNIRRDPYQMVNLAGGSTAEIRRLVLECWTSRIRKGQPIEECSDDRGYPTEPEIVRLP